MNKIEADRYRRSWNCYFEDEMNLISFFKRKLRFIKKIRHLKARLSYAERRWVKTWGLHDWCEAEKSRLEELNVELNRREIAVLALEKSHKS